MQGLPSLAPFMFEYALWQYLSQQALYHGEFWTFLLPDAAGNCDVMIISAE
jgi:hypothetical protein